jgi:hypothetical protein
VNGALVAKGDEIALCETLAESDPPQCGAPRLRVDGLDLSTIATLQTSGETRWAERVQLLGHVKDHTLTVTPGSTG